LVIIQPQEVIHGNSLCSILAHLDNVCRCARQQPKQDNLWQSEVHQGENAPNASSTMNIC